MLQWCELGETGVYFSQAWDFLCRSQNEITSPSVYNLLLYQIFSQDDCLATLLFQYDHLKYSSCIAYFKSNSKAYVFHCCSSVVCVLSMILFTFGRVWYSRDFCIFRFYVFLKNGYNNQIKFSVVFHRSADKTQNPYYC